MTSAIVRRSAAEPGRPTADSSPEAESSPAAIEPTLAAIRARLGHVASRALHPGLVSGAAAGWIPATRFADGSAVPELLDTAVRHWQGQRPAAAGLAWKSYTYWVALPAVAGFAALRRVPLLRPEDVVVDLRRREPFLAVGLRPAAVAVLPSDPLAAAGLPGIQVVRDEPALLDALRESLLDAHLDPVLEQIRAQVRLGRRTLLGSVASGVAYGVRLALADDTPEATIGATSAVLEALGLADLVELSRTGSGRVHIQRRTCCLAFTLPNPKICVGCCLRPAVQSGR